MSKYIDIDNSNMKFLVGRKVWVNPEAVKNSSHDYSTSAGKIGTIYAVKDREFLYVKFPDGTEMNGASPWRFKLVTSKLERTLK